MNTATPHWLVWVLIFYTFFSPFVLWFVLEARVARVNVWGWAACAILAVGLPLLCARGLRYLLPGPWTTNSTLAKLAYFLLWPGAGVLLVTLVHKHFLKPRRVEKIGPSLNYIGGWLGTLILQLFGTVASALIAIYRDSGAAVPDMRLTEMLSNVSFSSWRDALGNGLYLVALTGFTWAGFALILKKPYAVALTGYVAALTFAAEVLYGFTFELSESMEKSGAVYKPGRGNFIYNLVWVGYLMRSRRIREVYGKNFSFTSSSTERMAPNENSQTGEPGQSRT